MAQDPRQRAKPILFGGEDAMDVDEAIPASLPEASLSVERSSNELIDHIVQPSPYPQHNVGSSRFRNALNRVTAAPTKDTEAWQALMTEVNSCYKAISNIHSMDADTHAKLDWVESCYGALLKHFPYATSYYVTAIEMLLAQSARVGEENGPLVDYGMDPSRRAQGCERKVEHLLPQLLGVNLDGSPVQDNVLGGMCVWCVELWLLYIRKCVRDANRRAMTLAPDERTGSIRQATQAAYETAVAHAGFCHNNHLLWKQYVAFVKSWIPDPAHNTDHALAQQQMIQLRSVYQRLITHPMIGLDQLWQEYEAFERGQSEALAQALIEEFEPKYKHARSIYLERSRVYNFEDLQLGRLATPPVEDQEEEDYVSKMQEEYNLLTLWKKRCSYERTNLAASDLSQRIRCAYKEMACALTRYPESWHMWSTWELLGPESSGGNKVGMATAVLQLGQQHVPDSTLLSFAEAQVVELHTETPGDSMAVMNRFLDRAPNTLGFILYQQMVRRYKGIEAAREVFARARRVLGDAEKPKEDKGAAANPDAIEGEGDDGETDQSGKKEDDSSGKRWMVTNRLNPEIGSKHIADTNETSVKAEVSGDTTPEAPGSLPPGPITWHLYASHANMEHRLNRCPEIAARVYELGLRKHSSFLTQPPFVRRYAQLLLELNDTMNLRALLTRAVAACEAQEKSDALAALWDTTLQFESVLSGSDQSSVSALHKVERRRREALMGADVEDVSTGGFVGVGEATLIGAQKSTIAEQLIRSEGYDVSSNIVNGMSRTVDVLEVMGLWGSGELDAERSRRRMKPTSSRDKDVEISGGKSDASYQKRLQFQNLTAAGLPADAALADGGGTAGSKLLSARERLQGAAGVTAPGPASAMMLAIQAAPEWIRPLLLLLPASRLRLPVVAKPPPHMVEMALSTLRQNALPTERPVDASRTDSRRKREADGDSSDDENGGRGGGYGNQFRSRQRARMSSANGMTDL